jgi:hypothetical protein
VARAPRTERPVIIGHIEPGHDCYASRGQLVNAITRRRARRWWKFRGQLTTIEHDHQCYAKTPHGFTDHESDGALLELVREAREYGVALPTGYADVFHKTFRTPRTHASVNLLFAPRLAGGWQQALQTGALPGTWRLYDLRSAYLWASSLGLPDPASFTFTNDVRPDRPGLYRVQLECTVADAPYPFNTFRDVNATDHEIQLYGLPVRDVLGGVTWRRDYAPADRIDDTLRRVSWWKAAGRSYWGRWAQSEPVTCATPATEWQLPAFGQMQPWAHLITARIRERLFHVTGPRAAHVFVDSVLTTDRLPVGDSIGDWVLKHTYRRGVFVDGAGRFGDLETGCYDKAAGIVRPVDGSPRVRRIRFDPTFGNIELPPTLPSERIA